MVRSFQNGNSPPAAYRPASEQHRLSRYVRSAKSRAPQQLTCKSAPKHACARSSDRLNYLPSKRLVKQCAVEGADPQRGETPARQLVRFTRCAIGRRKINLMLTVGSQGLYEWLVTDQQFDLLQISPEVVLGKYIAITSIDSGPLVPTDDETAAGWESRKKIAYSPKIQTIQCLPRAGWDEWYIFGNPTDLGTS